MSRNCAEEEPQVFVVAALQKDESKCRALLAHKEPAQSVASADFGPGLQPDG